MERDQVLLTEIDIQRLYEIRQLPGLEGGESSTLRDQRPAVGAADLFAQKALKGLSDLETGSPMPTYTNRVEKLMNYALAIWSIPWITAVRLHACEKEGVG